MDGIEYALQKRNASVKPVYEREREKPRARVQVVITDTVKSRYIIELPEGVDPDDIDPDNLDVDAWNYGLEEVAEDIHLSGRVEPEDSATVDRQYGFYPIEQEVILG